MEAQTHLLLVMSSYTPEEDSGYDTSEMPHSRLSSITATPIFEMMPIYPQDRSPCITGNPEFCQHKWKASLLVIKDTRI